ncbi:MAG: GNAT family N-acetyltransferase [Lachnospiraceae bacterium]|nr:GNAT family N-acetyltransferase [Lachnospiraceae bacterium]MDE6252394.1 GNAT family N-acetyltransferase [Lachnospiraceae bacterium]
MNTITTSNLTKNQISDINLLLKTCRSHDNINGCISLDSSINSITYMPCFFLTYEGKTLCSILTIFTPTDYECEIYAYTLPEYRQKHLFSNILSKALKHIKKSTIQNIYLVAEPNSISATMTAAAMNILLDYSEYMLSYDMNITPSPEHILSINHLKENNTDTIHLTYEHTLIALCHLYIHETYASIFDFEVIEKYRGKGYGREALLMLIEYLIKLNISSITLNVSSKNKKAHKLYTSHGFFIKEQLDYYHIPVNYILF